MYIHTNIHAYIHTYIDTYIDTYIHTCIHTYIHCDWFTHPVAQHQRSAPCCNERRPHLFTAQLLLDRNPSNPSSAKEMPATATNYGSRGIHLPRPPFADHSNNVCGNMNMGSHKCMAGGLIQSRKLLEIHTPKT